MKCFVCDVDTTDAIEIGNVFLSQSKESIIKKLGQLFSERFYVVCDDDVICSSCISLLNKLDVLDEERAKLKRTVLGLIENKYSLNNGDLCGGGDDEPYERPPSFAARKRVAEIETDKLASQQNSSDDPRSRIWMQCGNCKYTTDYMKFVNRHVQKQFCIYCNGPKSRNGNCVRKCPDNDKLTLGDDGLPLTSSNSQGLMPNNLTELKVGADAVFITEATVLEGQISIPDNEQDDDKELYYNVIDSDQGSGTVRKVVFSDTPGEQFQIVSWNEETNTIVPMD